MISPAAFSEYRTLNKLLIGQKYCSNFMINYVVVVATDGLFITKGMANRTAVVSSRPQQIRTSD